MAQTPEGKIKDKVKAVLKKHGAYYFMPVQTGYGASTLDFLVCHKGNFIAIETKAPGKKLTARQEVIVNDIAAAKGWTVTIDGEALINNLDFFLSILEDAGSPNNEAFILYDGSKVKL